MPPKRHYSSRGDTYFVIGDYVCAHETNLFKGVRTVKGFVGSKVNLSGSNHNWGVHPAHLWLCTEDGTPIEAFCPRSDWNKWIYDPYNSDEND